MYLLPGTVLFFVVVVVVVVVVAGGLICSRVLFVFLTRLFVRPSVRPSARSFVLQFSFNPE